MSFSIVLYSISKKNNSTKQPSGSSKTLTGALRDDCDIINPVVSISFAGPYSPQAGRPVPMTAEFNPCDYNYAVISEWKRNYFIDSWEWSGGLWWAHMSVDPLGTYKSEIGSHNFYITRAAADFDYNIVDHRYIHKANSAATTLTQAFLKPNYFTYDYKEGIIVAQIMGCDSNSAFYVFNVPEWGAILNALYPRETDTLGQALSKLYQNAIVGSVSTVMQNIESIKWLPIDLTYSGITSADVTVGPLWLGQYFTGKSDAISLTGQTCKTYSQNINFPQRSDSSRGIWTKLEPFAEYSIYLPPFGKIAVDSQHLVEYGFKMSIDRHINFCNGEMVVNLWYGETTSVNRLLCGTFSTCIAVTIKANNTAVNASNIIDPVASMYGEVGKTAASFVDAGMGEFLQRNGSSIISSSMLPPNFNDLMQTCSVFYEPVEDNNVEWGKPLCKYKTPASVGNGFMQCAEGCIDITGATKGELDQIKRLLESGFYYE